MEYKRGIDNARGIQSVESDFHETADISGLHSGRAQRRIRKAYKDFMTEHKKRMKKTCEVYKLND